MKNIKVLQINIWGGRIKDGLADFISDGNCDVVCMQEAVWDKNKSEVLELFVDTVDKIKKQGDFKFDFRSSNFGVSMLNGEVQYECGNVILSKIPFQETEEKTILGEYGCATSTQDYEDAIIDHRYTAQKAVLENGLVILNYHGYWLKDPLGDEVTVSCMKSVADMIRNEKRLTLMCGDLNIIPEAKGMRELDFMTDLTATNNVVSTLRNIRFKKDVPCDHILVNNNVLYDNFKVIDAPVSDHKALSVDIKL